MTLIPFLGEIPSDDEDDPDFKINEPNFEFTTNETKQKPDNRKRSRQKPNNSQNEESGKRLKVPSTITDENAPVGWDTLPGTAIEIIATHLIRENESFLRVQRDLGNLSIKYY